VVYLPSEKYESDWIIIPTIGENKIHVPNHQPVVFSCATLLCTLSALDSNIMGNCEPLGAGTKPTQYTDEGSHLVGG